MMDYDKVLQRPFPPAAIKQTRMGADYVEASSVLWRLLEAWGTKWSLTIVETRIEPKAMVGGVVAVHVRLKGPDGHERDAWGVAQQLPMKEGSQVPNLELAFKAATTDAVKVAAHWIGVALHLYGEPVEENGEMPYSQEDVVSEAAPWAQDVQPAPPFQPRPAPQASSQGGPPHLNDIMPFGKYGTKSASPQTYGQVLMRDIDYLRWCASKERPDQKSEAIMRWLANHPEEASKLMSGGAPPQVKQAQVSEWDTQLSEEVPW